MGKSDRITTLSFGGTVTEAIGRGRGSRKSEHRLTPVAFFVFRLLEVLQVYAVGTKNRNKCKIGLFLGRGAGFRPATSASQRGRTGYGYTRNKWLIYKTFCSLFFILAPKSGLPSEIILPVGKTNFQGTPLGGREKNPIPSLCLFNFLVIS